MAPNVSQEDIRWQAEQERKQRERKRMKLAPRPIFNRVRGSIEITHKLEPEQRKERREDNKTMAKSRQQHRRRKRHGR